MRRTPSRAMRCAVEATKFVVVAVIAFLAVSTALLHTQSTASGSGAVPSGVAVHPRLDALMAEHDCSHTGFAPGVVPGSALVERGQRLLQVGFDEGWAVFTGDAPGVLVAVCRAPA